MSLRIKIGRYLKRQDCWIHKGEIEKKAIEHGYMGETAGRMLRKLEEQKYIESTQRKGVKGNYYKFIQKV